MFKVSAALMQGQVQGQQANSLSEVNAAVSSASGASANAR